MENKMFISKNDRQDESLTGQVCDQAGCWPAVIFSPEITSTSYLLLTLWGNCSLQRWLFEETWKGEARIRVMEEIVVNSYALCQVSVWQNKCYRVEYRKKPDYKQNIHAIIYLKNINS